jgi:23S rRNA-/tRNA-specific pseudouridylate synthase
VKRWIVRPGDGASIADVLSAMKEDPRAIGEGRVFVGRKRISRGDEAVAIGDEISVGDARAERDVEILFERDGLVACVKPAGIPTVPDHGGSAHALVARVARAIGKKTADLRVTSRLDREVSGVVVFALDAAAQARLERARAEGAYVRRYVAIASNPSALRDRASPFVWDAPIGLGKDARHRAAHGRDAKASRTNVKVVECTDLAALLAVEPVTGRTHQIRVHAAHAGAPLLGDRDYGGPTRLTLPGGRVIGLSRIALHAARVSVPDATGAPLVALAPIPTSLSDLWSMLGGAPASWEIAVEIGL